MKLINEEEEDLFLHDFSKNKSGDPSRDNEEEQKAVRPPVIRQNRQFSFAAEEEEERRSSRRSRRGGCGFFAWFFVIVIASLAVAFYIRYYIPHTTDSRTRGYVTVVEKRGILFKTFEGELVPETQISDSSRIYSRDFQFSIPDDSLGRLLQSYQGTGRPVTITTKKYYGSLPWRGATNTILTDISEK